MKILKILAALVLLGVLLWAGGNKPAASLQQTTWTLTKLNGKKVNAPRTQLILHENLKAYGSGGVNRFTGIYRLGAANNDLVFGALASTKMLGLSPEVNQIENDFFGALAQTKRYKINGKTLILLDAGNKTLAELTAS